MKHIIAKTLLTLAPIPASISAIVIPTTALSQKKDEKIIEPELLDVRNNVLYGFAPGVTAEQIALGQYDTLKIPDGVKFIAANAFSNAFDGVVNGVHTLILDKELESIGNNAFSQCYALDGQVNIQSCTHLRSIGANAFTSCGFEQQINFPNSLESIGVSAFEYCQLISGLVLPSSLSDVQANAFIHCTGIKNIDFTNFSIIPKWMYHANFIFYDVGSDAAKDERQVLFYAKNNTIDEWNEVFARQQLIDFNNKVQRVTNETCFKFNNDNQITGFSDSFNISDYDILVIPQQHNDQPVNTIVEGAFTEKIKDRIRINLSECSITEFPKECFKNCSGLYGDISLSSNLSKIGENCFDGCTNIGPKLDLTNCQASVIPNNAFSNCSNLREIILSGKITDINKKAFQGNKNVSILDVSKINSSNDLNTNAEEEGEYPFESFSKTGTIFVNENTTEPAILNWKNKLKSWGLSGLDEQLDYSDSSKWKISNHDHSISFDKDDFAISDNSVLHGFKKEVYSHISEAGLIKIPDTISKISDNAFDNMLFAANCQWTLEFDNGLFSIGNRAFANGTNIIGQLVFPKTLSYIGKSAFYKCCHLRGRLDIPSCVTYIGDNAFSGCSLLFSGNLSLPSAIETIGSYAFADTLIEKISVPNTLKAVGDCAFANMKVLNTIDLTSFSSVPTFTASRHSFYLSKDSGKILVKSSLLNSWETYLDSLGLPDGWEVEGK